MLYLILGYLFGAFGDNLLKNIVDFLISVLQMWTSKVAVKITESEVQIHKLQNSLQEEMPTQSTAIGFVVPSENEVEEENDN